MMYYCTGYKLKDNTPVECPTGESSWNQFTNSEDEYVDDGQCNDCFVIQTSVDVFEE